MMLYLDDERQPSGAEERETAARLAEALRRGEWDGLRDRCREAVGDRLWHKLSTDKANCLGRNCLYFRGCPFFLARREIEEAEVVVTNHALVMAALDSESVLPEPGRLLLVLDEGHHIPEVARDSLEVSGNITPEQVGGQLEQLAQQVGVCLAQLPPKSPPRLAHAERLAEHCAEVLEAVRFFAAQCAPFLAEGQDEYRFPLGRLPEEMRAACLQLSRLAETLRGLAEYMLNDLGEKSGKYDAVRLHHTMLRLSRLLGYLEAFGKLWRLAALEQASQAPIAKWLTRERRDGQTQLHLHCAGIRVSDQLDRLLWHNVSHVVVTSATLRSLKSFSRLQELSGLSEESGDRFMALESPFNHREQGRLVIPRMRHEPVPADEERHIAEMARFFRAELHKGGHRGILMLFASQRAMLLFLERVADLRPRLLVQGDRPRYRLIEEHRRRVGEGQVSALVGLQSFAEGLDLQGELLSQVHIHKIAFPPIDSPVIVTEGEWLQSRKRHPFLVQSLPSASFTLIQQVGRLIRSHGCFGEIVIYDRRLLTRGYGARLLAALPVFPIERRAVPAEEDGPYE